MSCQAAVVSYGNNAGCFHVTTRGAKVVPDADAVLYDVTRVCPTRAQGRPKYHKSNIVCTQKSLPILRHLTKNCYTVPHFLRYPQSVSPETISLNISRRTLIHHKYG